VSVCLCVCVCVCVCVSVCLCVSVLSSLCISIYVRGLVFVSCVRTCICGCGEVSNSVPKRMPSAVAAAATGRGSRKRKASELSSGEPVPKPKHRSAGAKAAPIMKCAYRACSRQKDCRHTMFSLQRTKVDIRQCRQGLKEHAQKIRFCCADHMDRCGIQSSPRGGGGKQGARAQMNAEQCGALFDVCLSVGMPWLAVLFRLQLETVQRGCVPSSARIGDLKYLTVSGCGASLHVPAHKTTSEHMAVMMASLFARSGEPCL